ncbi:MAG: uracil-DNA glycosylase [Rickettsiales bacterium]|nr:uracil-DNA glycosylase [Rickettsiales bacterium]
MKINLESSWAEKLKDEFSQYYWTRLLNFLDNEYKSGTDIFPEKKDIFSALNACPFDSVRVVILGQDPYHGWGQAHGFCFSVPDGVAVPPSLRNIIREIENDTGEVFPLMSGGDISYLAGRGVLMLNSVLSVRSGAPASHAGQGWEQFTDSVIRALNKKSELVYLLWGDYAAKKAAIIDETKNLVLRSAHPSPLSAYHGFFGNHHFTRANDYLVSRGFAPIKWVK